MPKSKENGKKPVGDPPAFITKIIVSKSGKVNLTDFPINMWNALDLIRVSGQVLEKHFQVLQQEGKLDANGTIKKSNILTPNKMIVLPGGKA